MDKQEFKLPRYKDIPDVGLLLDQVARLINGYLEPFEDIRLTNSMISNYVKHGIIARPVKKLYYREQIAALIFIAVSKTVLSLDDIDAFLRIQREGHTPEAAYDLFCDGFEDALTEGLRHGYIPDANAHIHTFNKVNDSGVTHSAVAHNADYAALSDTDISASAANDSCLLHSLLKAVADCITLKELLAARKTTQDGT